MCKIVLVTGDLRAARLITSSLDKVNRTYKSGALEMAIVPALYAGIVDLSSLSQDYQGHHYVVLTDGTIRAKSPIDGQYQRIDLKGLQSSLFRQKIFAVEQFRRRPEGKEMKPHDAEIIAKGALRRLRTMVRNTPAPH